MVAFYGTVRAVHTDTVPVDAYRGAGLPEATYRVERMLETAAREMGMDPAALRRKNFIREFPYQTQVILQYDSGDYVEILDKAEAAADVKGFAGRKSEAAKRGKLRGIGYSTSGALICEVEVDPDTGETEIVQFTAADDFGTIIDPMIVAGQVHGGVAQGIGRRCTNRSSMTTTVSF